MNTSVLLDCGHPANTVYPWHGPYPCLVPEPRDTGPRVSTVITGLMAAGLGGLLYAVIVNGASLRAWLP